MFNFCDQPQTVTCQEALFPGVYTDYFSGETVELTGATQLILPAWGYRVFVRG